jgi:NAD-dependent SIR2 family protein deacetylase
VDGLHTKSGLRESLLIEAHGNYDKAMCAGCQSPFDNDAFVRGLKAGQPVYCDQCSAPIKPTAVFFSE